MKIVFASWNYKKLEEIKRMAPNEIEIICLKDLPEAQGIEQAEENGTTFIENAEIKAKYWADILNMPVLAEDSGIEIEALNGYPGVYTKRCIEKLCPNSNINIDNPSELYPKLIELVEESENSTKLAYWVSAIVLIIPGKAPYCSVHKIAGEICECAGERVFGFDQYFKPENSTKTLSEMLPEEKDSIGPRKKAFNEIIEQLPFN